MLSPLPLSLPLPSPTGGPPNELPSQDSDQQPCSPFSVFNLFLSFNDVVHDFGGVLNNKTSSTLTSVQTTQVNSWLGQSRSLDLKEYTEEQKLALSRACQRRLLAEERVHLKRLKEISAIRKALHGPETENERVLYYKAQQALAVARAARETFAAEDKLAAERVNEAEISLQSLRAVAEAAKGKLGVAERQIGDLLNKMERQGVLPTSPVDHDDDDGYDSEFISRRQGQHYYWPHSDDNESVFNGLESVYDEEPEVK